MSNILVSNELLGLKIAWERIENIKKTITNVAADNFLLTIFYLFILMLLKIL